MLIGEIQYGIDYRIVRAALFRFHCGPLQRAFGGSGVEVIQKDLPIAGSILPRNGTSKNLTRQGGSKPEFMTQLSYPHGRTGSRADNHCTHAVFTD
jgi:hypothetical protein